MILVMMMMMMMMKSLDNQHEQVKGPSFVDLSYHDILVGLALPASASAAAAIAAAAAAASPRAPLRAACSLSFAQERGTKTWSRLRRSSN